MATVPKLGLCPEAHRPSCLQMLNSSLWTSLSFCSVIERGCLCKTQKEIGPWLCLNNTKLWIFKLLQNSCLCLFISSPLPKRKPLWSFLIKLDGTLDPAKFLSVPDKVQRPESLGFVLMTLTLNYIRMWTVATTPSFCVEGISSYHYRVEVIWTYEVVLCSVRSGVHQA